MADDSCPKTYMQIIFNIGSCVKVLLLCVFVDGYDKKNACIYVYQVFIVENGKEKNHGGIHNPITAIHYHFKLTVNILVFLCCIYINSVSIFIDRVIYNYVSFIIASSTEYLILLLQILPIFDYYFHYINKYSYIFFIQKLQIANLENYNYL